MQIAFIFSLIFAIIIAVFALQNSEPVTVNFLFTNVEVSQAIVIFVSAALGAIIGAILGAIRQVKLTFKIKEQNKKIKGLEETKMQLEKRIEELTYLKTEAKPLEEPSKEVVVEEKDVDTLINEELEKVEEEKKEPDDKTDMN